MNGTEIGNVIEPAAFLAVLGLVIWVVKRVFSHTIPRLATDFKESLSQQAAAFMAQLETQRNDFKEQLAYQRNDFREALREEREQLGKRLDRLSEAVESLLIKGQRERNASLPRANQREDDSR